MKYIFRTIMTAAVMAACMTAVAQTEVAVAVEEVSKPAPQVKVRKAQRGIIVVDSAGIVRAMSPFAGSQANARKYAAAVNRYSRETGDSVKVYSMVVPLAIAYYCPENAPVRTADQVKAIDDIYDALDKEVTPVDIYYALWDHRSEPIYSRTDHHWAPLGAYYAAGELAEAAGVDFLPLDSYEPDTLRTYVGTMYTFSKDRAVKNSPEDFVFYVPKSVDYKADFITYRVGTGNRVLSETPIHESDFFKHYPDGSVGAYSTYMGGDQHTVKVTTGTKNGRKLMIIKDSFGNAVAGFMFGSFEEIHVIDFRYFNRNIKDYIKSNGITDVAIINNISHAYAPMTAAGLERMLDK